MDNIVPRRNVTLLGGHGGSGKSLLALVIADHCAEGRDWAGLSTVLCKNPVCIPGRPRRGDTAASEAYLVCAPLKRQGQLPYGWITDATRRGYFVDAFSSAADFVRRMAGLYRGDLCARSDSYVEIWCESRSIASVIE